MPTNPPPNETWHGVSHDTIFTTFITIFIFIAGYIANRLYDRYKRNKELKILKKYFCYVVEHIDEPIRKQVTNFVKFSHALKTKTKKNYHLGHSLVPALENIKNIKHSDLYDIFLNVNSSKIDMRAKNLQKFHESIYLMEYVYTSYPKRFNDFSEALSKHEKKWNVSITSIVRCFDEFVSDAVSRGIQRGKDMFLEEVDELLKKNNKNPDYRRPNIAIKIFIHPLIEICKKFIGDGRATVLLKYSLECNEAYENSKNAHYVYRKYFILTARSLNKARIDLYKSFEELNCR